MAIEPSLNGMAKAMGQLFLLKLEIGMGYSHRTNTHICIYICVYTHTHTHASIRVSVCVCMLSHVLLFATPWTIDLYAPLFMGFSRQEYWSGLPFPTPDLYMDYR